MARRLKVSEKTLALRKVPLFALCSDKELEQLAGLATEVEVHAEQVLCTIGEPGYEFFVLLDGTCRHRPFRRQHGRDRPG